MPTPSRPLPAPSRREQRANAKALAFASKTRPRPELPSDRQRSTDERTAHPPAPRRTAPRPPAATGRSAAPRTPAATGRSAAPSAPGRTRAAAQTATATRGTSASRPSASRGTVSTAARSTASSRSSGLQRNDGLATMGAAALAPSPRLRAVEDPRARSEAAGRKRERLQVVPRTPRNRRRVFGMLVVGVLTVMTFVIGFAAVVMHATLAKDQLVLDRDRTQVQQAERANQHLRVEVAELESPERIVAEAALLGMKSPDEVTFMPAIGTGAVVPVDAAAPASAPRVAR